MAHVAHQVVEGFDNGLAVDRILGDEPGIEIGVRQCGLVVEHLLEVRQLPFAIDCVAMESAANVIANAAIRDGFQRIEGDAFGNLLALGIQFLDPTAAEKEGKVGGAGKVGAASKGSRPLIE